MEPRPAPCVHVQPRSDTIRVEDLRALFRLEGELNELPADSEEQWRHALHGLVALIGAQVAILGAFGGLVRGGGVIHRSIHFGWSTDRDRDVFESYLREGQTTMPDPSIRRVARSVDRPICTLNRTQLITDGEWYQDAHVQEYRRGCGVDAFLHSVRVERDAGYVISLHRAWGEPAFTERERNLVDIFHRESRALARRTPAKGLSPHLDRTLHALLRGLSEKQVAAELGLSPHTVHEYVKALYRKLGVSSRSELFVRFRGNGASLER